ncbi:MAG: vWA domain-containing protein [Rubrivivax sp.]|jgi:hypothetical protein
MSNLFHLLRRTGAALALATTALASHAAPTTQLGFLIDASGSIGSTNFNTMRSGYAAALAALPTDGSIEVTVYTFSNSTVQVVAPTVVTAASLPGIVSSINGMGYTASTTATAAGITAISNAMLASSNYSAGLRSIINVATDGQPNDGSSNPSGNAITAATNARNNGIDALTAEAIGSFNSNFLLDLVFSPLTGPCDNCGVLLPDGSTPTNPMTSTPWVLQVNSFDDFPTAINAKVQAIVNDVPEPGALALSGLALLLVAVQRRRASAAQQA